MPLFSAHHTDDGAQPVTIARGTHHLNIIIENTLQAGRYVLAIGAHSAGSRDILFLVPDAATLDVLDVTATGRRSRKVWLPDERLGSLGVRSGLTMGAHFVITVPWGRIKRPPVSQPPPPHREEARGYERVFVSRRSAFRREDYRTLVWEMNPFVDGFTDEEGPVPVMTAVPDGMNLLDAIMLARGLDDGRRFHEAEVFYVPKKVHALAGAHVYDPNYVSHVGDLSPRRLRAAFRRGGMPDAQCRPGIRAGRSRASQSGQTGIGVRLLRSHCVLKPLLLCDVGRRVPWRPPSEANRQLYFSSAATLRDVPPFSDEQDIDIAAAASTAIPARAVAAAGCTARGGS
ncbi:MAG: hypothetical protein IPP94_13665 [Ignavibacteria bacterium]|nr:hypothetical protein [Ignavibacteria bacterium]